MDHSDGGSSVESGDLADLIQSTHSALLSIGSPPVIEPAAPDYSPAVTIRKSLGSREHILSLIDGKPYKTLKRHLSGHGLTPSEYRERYKLPADYPMVAPAYSDHRRDVARTLGLGRKSVKTADADVAADAAPVEPPVESALSAPPMVDAPETATPKRKAAKTPSPAKSKPVPKRVQKTAVAHLKPAEARQTEALVEAAPSLEVPALKTEKKTKAVSSGVIKPKRAAASAPKAASGPRPVTRAEAEADSPATPTE